MKQILFLILLLNNVVWSKHNYSNALITENSPYLQQHAHNPINWYPWGNEAFEKAEKEHKLIFLSIGYSTCHWCHVMEEESFTDIGISKVLNEGFVSIKVDREEYPQIDKKYQRLYMNVHSKRGGWPLSVFMSSKKEVFFIGTYIPKDEGYGSKGLVNLLPTFIALQKETVAFGKSIDKHQLQKRNTALKITQTDKMIQKVLAEIAMEFDEKNGGFSTRPKFPEASKLELLLDIYKLNANPKAYEMAKVTLNKMAQGGIYDQIGGGFFRYTVDATWQTPHFEKMLYTNAELIALYVKFYAMTKDALYKKVIDESITQFEKNYMSEKVYFSASDADSDGEEGGYFIYEYIEVKSDLKYLGWKPKEIEDALAYMGIEEDGNIDGDFSHTHITSYIKPKRLNELKAYLASLSAKRTFPFVDKKIITAWNSMMIKALFEASTVDTKYLSLAKKRLHALLNMMYPRETLYHQTVLGKTPKQKALLEDYAFLVDALLAAYNKTYEKKYLTLANKLIDEGLYKFYREKQWYLSDDGIEAHADFDDRYYTSALSLMLENLVRMSALTENLKYITVARESIINLGVVLKDKPSSASKLVHTFLRLEKGDIVIHAKKEKLLSAQKVLDNVLYPFILSTIQESDEYLACKTTMCFAYDSNITKLIKKINKVVK